MTVVTKLETEVLLLKRCFSMIKTTVTLETEIMTKY